MSRTGNPYDNAQVESFIKTLKHEEVYLHDYGTVLDAIDRLPHFLEDIYKSQTPAPLPGLPAPGGTRPYMRRLQCRSIPMDPPVHLQRVTPLRRLKLHTQ